MISARRRSSTDGAATGWSQLDRDSLIAITGCLDNARDVASLACTCRDAHSAASENSIWAPLLYQYFGLNVQAPDRVSLARMFRQLQAVWANRRLDQSAKASEASGSSHNRLEGDGVKGPAVVRFEGLYTDGGMDEDDPAFWAGNLFDPSGWTIYCSQASSNVHCIGLLKAALPDQPFLATHRREIITLAADVAWVLFLHRAPKPLLQRLAAPDTQFGPLHERLRRCMWHSLAHWCTHGLERLLLELVVWFEYLQEALQDQEQQQQQQQQRRRGSGRTRMTLQTAAEHPKPLATQQQQQQAAAAAAGTNAGADAGPSGIAKGPRGLPARLAVVVRDIQTERSFSGARGLVGLDDGAGRGGGGEGDEDGGGEDSAEAARGERPRLRVWSRWAGEWMASAGLEQSTAIVDGITVSRAGEFTCPVSCGAVFLTHLEPMPRATTRGSMTQTGAADGPTDPSDPLSRILAAAGPWVEPTPPGESPGAVFDSMVRQPYVQAMSGLTDLAAVEAAVAAGLLPPIAARGSSQGAGEWIEFQRPPPAGPPLQGQAAHQLHQGAGGDGTASCSGRAAAGGGPSAGAAEPYGATSHAGRRDGDNCTRVGGGGCGEPAGPSSAGPVGGGGRAGGATGGGGAGILWPAVWFRFFPHQRLGDEGDQAMALPPVMVLPHAPPANHHHHHHHHQQVPHPIQQQLQAGAPAAAAAAPGPEAAAAAVPPGAPAGAQPEPATPEWRTAGASAGPWPGAGQEDSSRGMGTGGGGGSDGASGEEFGGSGLGMSTSSGGSSDGDDDGGGSGEAGSSGRRGTSSDGEGGAVIDIETSSGADDNDTSSGSWGSGSSGGGVGGEGECKGVGGTRGRRTAGRSGAEEEEEEEQSDWELQPREEEGEENDIDTQYYGGEGGSGGSGAVQGGGAGGAGGSGQVQAPVGAGSDGLGAMFGYDWEEELDFLYGIDPKGPGGSDRGPRGTAVPAADSREGPAAAESREGAAGAAGAGCVDTAGAAAGTFAAALPAGEAAEREAVERDGEASQGGAVGRKRQRGQNDGDAGGPGPSGSGGDGGGVTPQSEDERGAARGSSGGRRGGGGGNGGGDGGGGGGGPGPSGGGGDDDSGGEGVFGGPKELLQGVPLSAWMRNLTRPHVVGLLLEVVSDAAGVQALRHTFQNVQTALQQELLLGTSAGPQNGCRTAVAVHHRQGQGHHQHHRHHHHDDETLQGASHPHQHQRQPHGAAKPWQEAGGSRPDHAPDAATVPQAASGREGTGGAQQQQQQQQRSGSRQEPPLVVLLPPEDDAWAGGQFLGIEAATVRPALPAPGAPLPPAPPRTPAPAPAPAPYPTHPQPTQLEAAPAARPPQQPPPPQSAPLDPGADLGQQQLQGSMEAPHGGPAAAAAAPAAAQGPVPVPVPVPGGGLRAPSGHLCMQMLQRWAGNTVLVKLIGPENRTSDFGEDDDDAPLNIDVQFVAFRGVALALKPPLRLV